MATQKRWFGRLSRMTDGWRLFVVSLICGSAFLWLLVDAVLDQEKPLAGIIILPLLGLLAIVAQLKLSWRPERRSMQAYLRSGKGGATVTMAVGDMNQYIT